jgi:hypothetical protein
MRTTVTIHRRDKVIDLDQGQGQWTLSAEDMLFPPFHVGTHPSPIDATDTAIPLVEPEWEWIQENEESLRENYPGRWIAVLLNRVVAIGEGEIDVLRSAEELGYENPFTFYVRTRSEPVAMAGCC